MECNENKKCDANDPGTIPTFVEQTAASVHEMIASSAPLPEILTRLARAGERLAGKDSAVSILVLDEDGLLRNGASPKLPADYLQAIDRLLPNPLVGTCAAAAATGCVVITPDFRADEKWAELRHLPLALGYSAAWSMPIKNLAGIVLGTYGTYFRESRTPTPDEINSVQILASVAALALGSN